MKHDRTQTRQLVLTALFAALIAVGAFLRIPIPYLSFSMQTLFVALAAILLGRKWGTAAVLVYLAVGLSGLPIFTQGGGVGYVLQPSFGFLVGFVLWTLVSGGISSRYKTPTVRQLFLAQLPGIGLMYAVGMVYFYLIQNFYQNDPMTVQTLFLYCFATTFPGDVLKSLLAAWLGKRLVPALRRPAA